MLESELGGISEYSQQQLFKNIIYDYTKLLIRNSKYKVMIMGISSFSKESDDWLKHRINLMYKLYKKSGCSSNMLVVAIEEVII